MFKSLKKRLDRKEQSFREDQSTLAIIRATIPGVLSRAWGSDARHLRIHSSYQLDEKILFLAAESKALANELVSLAPQLAEQLKQRGVVVKRIVVR